MSLSTIKRQDDILLKTSAELIEDEFELNQSQKSELDKLYEDVSNKFKVGKIVTGTIISNDSNGVLVNIDYKSEGLISGYEFSKYELQNLPAGTSIDVLLDHLEDENGSVVLSYQKAKALKAWDKITDLAAHDEPVRGIVTHKVKGGLNVDVGIPAFLPGSQIDVQRILDFDQFVGQEVVCKILKVNKKRGNIIISRRKFIEEQRFEDKKKILETIAEGQVLEGTAKNITSYGVFVDIGGIDGLLHITDMSWGRISHPSEMVKLGDKMTVKVIAFDKMHEKISLGMKQLTPNPWEHVAEKYPVSSKITGKISSITDYGLFVEVEEGIEGLVHISEISWTERINNLGKYFTVGQPIEALVVGLDKENRRMSLSIKQIKADPWEKAKQLKVGDKISGHVTNITDFGIFVRVLEGVDGLVHISDISWTDHVSHPSERFKKNDPIEAVVLGIDPVNRKISLGIKQLETDPWITVKQQYKIGDMVEGIVSKITNFGAFVKLPTGIEGLVHISELSEKEVQKVEDILKIGETKSFRIIKVSPEERKLGLSLRPPKERPAGQQKSNDEQMQQKPVKREKFADNAAKNAESYTHDDADHATKPARETTKNALQQALEKHMKKQQGE